MTWWFQTVRFFKPIWDDVPGLRFFFGVDIPRGPIRNTEILATCLAFSGAIFLFVETWWFSHFLLGKPGKRISPLLY